MSGIRNILAVGLLMGGTGCANLQRSSMLQPPHQHDHAVADGPIDPFHPPVEPTGTRMSRFFPGLARHESSSPAVVESLRRGDHAPSDTDRDLRAVPRPEPDFDESASAPSRDERAEKKRRVARAGQGGPPDLSSADNEPIPERKSDLPLLTAAMVAEVDPSARKANAPIEIEPTRTREEHEARVASAALSPRRMPPMPAIDPRSRRPLPPRLPSIERGESLGRQDSETRLVRGRDEDVATEDGVKPLLAVGDALPASDNPGSLKQAEPTPVEPTATARPTASAETTLADRPGEPEVVEPAPAERPSKPVQAEPVQAPSDAPPDIAPAPEAESQQKPVREEPRTTAEPVDRKLERRLLGRPRMTRVEARRDNLPPDVPSAMFPKTYYGQDTPPGDKFPIEEASEPGRWTWRPRLWKKLRGE